MVISVEASLILGIVVVCTGAFWRIWGLIEKAKNEASLRAEAAHALASSTRAELAAHQLHVAETYVTKQGMSEQTDRIMTAINDVGKRVDGLGTRLDTFYQNQPTARSRAPRG